MPSVADSISQFNQLLEITRMRVDEVSGALATLNERSAAVASGSAPGADVSPAGISIVR